MAHPSHQNTIDELKKARVYIEHQEELRAKMGADRDREQPKASAHGMTR